MQSQTDVRYILFTSIFFVINEHSMTLSGNLGLSKGPQGRQGQCWNKYGRSLSVEGVF